MIRVRSTQKLPSRSVCVAGEAADQRDRDGDADGGRQEVLHGQPGHLDGVARGRPRPEYDCQLVLVTNETAVFNAPTAGTPGMPSD